MWIATRPGMPWAQILVGVTMLATIIMWLAVR